MDHQLTISFDLFHMGHKHLLNTVQYSPDVINNNFFLLISVYYCLQFCYAGEMKAKFIVTTGSWRVRQFLAHHGMGWAESVVWSYIALSLAQLWAFPHAFIHYCICRKQLGPSEVYVSLFLTWIVKSWNSLQSASKVLWIIVKLVIYYILSVNPDRHTNAELMVLLLFPCDRHIILAFQRLYFSWVNLCLAHHHHRHHHHCITITTIILDMYPHI